MNAANDSIVLNDVQIMHMMPATKSMTLLIQVKDDVGPEIQEFMNQKARNTMKYLVAEGFIQEMQWWNVVLVPVPYDKSRTS